MADCLMIMQWVPLLINPAFYTLQLSTLFLVPKVECLTLHTCHLVQSCLGQTSQKKKIIKRALLFYNQEYVPWK